MDVQEAIAYWAERDQTAKTRNTARVRRATGRAASAPKRPVQTKNLTMREGSLKWDIVRSAERFSQVEWERQSGYRDPRWELVLATCDIFGTDRGDGMAIVEGGYAIAQLVDAEDGQQYALCYSLFLNRHILARPEVLLWLERRAPQAPPAAPIRVTLTMEDQINDKLQEMADAVRSLAPGANHEAQFTIRTRWTDHDGLITYEELVGPEDRVTYSVYDGHGHHAEEASVSEAERSYWIEVALEDTCGVCESEQVQIVCAPEILGAHYFGVCQACYLNRPPANAEGDGELEVWTNTAMCRVHANCFGVCYRDSSWGQHLHLIDTPDGPLVVGVRAAGPEWFELVGRPVPLAEYQADTREA